MAEEINININNGEADDENESMEPEFDLDLNELKAPILEAGQTGKIILPVKVIRFGKEKVRVKKDGPAEMQGDFRSLTASELKKSLPNAER